MDTTTIYIIKLLFLLGLSTVLSFIFLWYLVKVIEYYKNKSAYTNIE